MTVNIANLDAAQQAAVEDLDGPVIIQANPGSGKTACIAARVALLLENGVHQDRVVCITFTNKAADEMRSRIESYSGVFTDGMWIGTFHSICASLLRIHGTSIGISPEFTICSERESRRLLREVIEHTHTGPRIAVRQVQGAISRIKQQCISLEDEMVAQSSGDDPTIKEHITLLYHAYQAVLRRRGALDFDDLVVEAFRLLRDGDTRRSVASQFEYVLIDEFQDTTPVEAEIVKALASIHGNVCIVGDPKQSIYRFRGSDYRLMGQFADAFPHCHTHTLDTNYRSARRIIAASEQLINSSRATPSNGVRPFRTDEGSVHIGRYETDSDEATAVALEIARLVTSGIASYIGITVLFRQHWVSETLKSVLKTAKIPFHVVNSDSDQVYEAIIECLRSVAQSDWSSTHASDWALANTDVISNLRGMVACGLSLENLVQKVIDQVCGSDWQSHPPQLSSLWAAANKHPGMARTALPALLAHLDEMAEDARPTDAVQLMSIHQSKGLQFPVVFLVGLEDGVLPCWQSLDDEDALEEERRLCYVAMTRAMDRLYLSTSQRRYANGRPRMFCESRFVAGHQRASAKEMC